MLHFYKICNGDVDRNMASECNGATPLKSALLSDQFSGFRLPFDLFYLFFFGKTTKLTCLGGQADAAEESGSKI